MKKSFYYFLFSFIFSAISFQSFASHMVGADMSYTCTTTPGVWHIKLAFYRDCTGIPVCSGGCSNACTRTISYEGADPSCSGYSFGTVQLNLTSVSDVNPNPQCPNAKSICDNNGCATPGSYTPGIEKYVFEGNIDLGPTSTIPSSCCNIRIIFQESARNGAIVTGSAGQNFYIETIINRCLSLSPCNSSPTLSNDPFAAICKGQPYIFNNGAVDPDQDSLSYVLTPALQGTGQSVTYNAPYSFDYPLPAYPPINAAFPLGFHCDSLTGDIAFTPNSGVGGTVAGPMVIEIKQWKTINGVPTNIGTTRRDIQIYILTCSPDNPPTILTNPSVGTQPKLAWTICAGNPICFDVIGNDSDFHPANAPPVSDTTYLSWNNVLASKGATFLPKYNIAQRKTLGPREDIYQFCWTPDTSMVSSIPWYFTITAKDSRCPNPGRISRAISILVKAGAPKAMINKSQLCNKWNFNYIVNSGSSVITSKQWQISNTAGVFNDSNYSIFSTSTISNISFADTGKFVVKLILTGDTSCGATTTIYDTAYHHNLFKLFSLTDTTFCAGTAGTQIKLKAIHSGGKSPFTLRWYDAVQSGTTLSSNDSLIVSPASTKNYVFKITDSLGCVLTDTASIKINPFPISTMPASARICSGTNFLLDPGGITSPNLKYLWNTGDTTKTISRNDSNLFWVSITDAISGCKIYDTLALFVNPLPNTNAGNDISICNGQSTILRASGASTYLWYAIPSSTVLSSKDSVSVAPISLTNYRVAGTQITSGLSCSKNDTVKVTVNALPTLTMPATQNICLNDALTFQMPSVTTSKPGGIGIWSHTAKPSAVNSSGLIAVNLLKNQPATPSWFANNYLTYLYTDSQGCVKKDSGIVSVHNTPNVNAGSDRSFCSYDSLYNISANQSASPAGGMWNGNTVYLQSPNYFFKPYLANKYPLTNSIVYAYTMTFTGGFSCTNFDSAIFTVNNKPFTSSIAGNASPNSGSIENYNVTNTSGSSYNWWITNGTQTSGTNSSSILVQWGNLNSGKVAVQETNNNCKGDTVSKNIAINNGIPDSLSLSIDTIKVTGATIVNVQLQSNRAWTITNTNQPWIIVSPMSGSGNTTLSVNISAATGIGLHDADITATAGIITKKLHIRQTILTGVDEVLNRGSIKIYPNPTTGLLNIEFETSEKNVQLEVFDVLGRSALKTTTPHHGGLFQKSLDISQLKEGVYFVKIIAGEKSTTVKVTLK